MKHEHGYWRSLEQLSGSSHESVDEFAAGVAEPPQRVSRREMLSLLGASMSFAGLVACRKPAEAIVPFVQAPENVIPGVPKYYATNMPFGLDAYGLLVESHEGRPTKIEGNRLHPSTHGASNSWIQASILDLYDPDRSQTVRHLGQTGDWQAFVTAWTEMESEYLASGGSGLALLGESFASPTLARLGQAFSARFPHAIRATYEPVGDDTSFAGMELAAGEPYRVMLRLENAEVVLSLDSDFLGVEADAVRNTRGFAAARDPERGSMNRLWVVESNYSLTGANADHRLRLAAADVPAFVSMLTAELRKRAGDLTLPAASSRPLPQVDARWLAALVDDLTHHRGRSLIVAGRRQPAAVHAAVYALNRALGNVGASVSYYEPLDAALPRGLEPLVRAMRDGQVSTLVILGCDPVSNAPADLAFGEAMEQVPVTVHLSSYLDATSVKASWHLNRAHYLESWGDVRAVDGTLGVTQPLIAPLFDGKSPVDVLGLLATGTDAPAYERVRETWKTFLDDGSFEKEWRRVLHDGLLDGSAVVAASPALTIDRVSDALNDAIAVPSDGYEVVFQASPALFDGRFANNGWLQEVPDALTKLSWDNPALISPHAADALGISNGEMVKITVGQNTIALPVWIMPGLAERSIVLYLGHRPAGGVGRIASRSGFDVYPLRTTRAMGHAGGATLEATGTNYALATTQEHGTMNEPNLAPWQKGKPERARDLVRQGTFEQFRRDPEFARRELAFPERSLWQERRFEQSPQWGMTIDLNACVGCNACVVACQSENNIPIVGKQQVGEGREMHWLRVDRYFTGAADDAAVVFQAVPCMQCENAPCEQVCPVGATVHDEQGLNAMVYNRCIGTRYCSNNCPYKVRRFNYFNFTKDTPESLALAYNPDVTVRSRGVMEKCTYCVQRINEGLIEAKLSGRPLSDGEIRTACQQACPATAIEFGDIRDDSSRVSRSKLNPRNYVLLEELFTKPRTTFLAKLRNPHPELAQADLDPTPSEGHH
ncbi:MAG TPA: Fe-S-cluster-containing hydrogenase [Candidatus Polarisedimenticolaceae bacterium]|nr:Fe-S-cluster-containing hydrogenase [Candidatus Polarisedimenticolaceae bacterium]